MIRIKKIRDVLPVGLLFALCVVPVLAAPETCGAKLSAEMLTEENADGEVRYEFEVTIEADSSCPRLTYDFLVEEMLPNRQAKIVRKPRRVELEEGLLTEIVEHTMTTDLELLGYDVRLVECDCPDGAS